MAQNRSTRHLLTATAAVPAVMSAIPHASEMLDHVAAATGISAAIAPSMIGIAALAGLALFALRTEIMHRSTRRQIDATRREAAATARKHAAAIRESQLAAQRRGEVRSRLHAHGAYWPR